MNHDSALWILETESGIFLLNLKHHLVSNTTEARLVTEFGNASGTTLPRFGKVFSAPTYRLP